MTWAEILALYGPPVILVCGAGLMTWHNRRSMQQAWEQSRCEAEERSARALAGTERSAESRDEDVPPTSKEYAAAIGGAAVPSGLLAERLVESIFTQGYADIGREVVDDQTKDELPPATQQVVEALHVWRRRISVEKPIQFNALALYLSSMFEKEILTTTRRAGARRSAAKRGISRTGAE